ncbi:MAG: helix-turn-helix domain-containing protein [Micromonosporaceae bacterium]
MRILLILRSGRALTRAQISAELHIAKATVAHHLQVLDKAGFVREAAPPKKLPRHGTAPGSHELTEFGRAVLGALER